MERRRTKFSRKKGQKAFKRKRRKPNFSDVRGTQKNKTAKEEWICQPPLKISSSLVTGKVVTRYRSHSGVWSSRIRRAEQHAGNKETGHMCVVLT